VAELRQAVVRCLEIAQRQQQRRLNCRSLLMKKVELFWIDGVLRSSLHTHVLLELGLMLHPEAIEHPWDLIVQREHQKERLLPPGTTISALLGDLDEAMLILGSPGAGKTTLLLLLAQELLRRAQQDDRQPIPVVFHLSTWAEHQLSLVEWLISELEKRYELPPRTARDCVMSNQLLLLLDGLDEVTSGQRERCVAAINTFRHEHGATPLVICSRTADYAVLSTRLRSAGAVMIQPLTRQKITDYLAQLGDSLTPLRTLLNVDEQLWELLQTPLMLNITALVYRRCPESVAQPAVTLEGRRRQLFATYTEVVFQRRGKTTRYTRHQTLQWLTWLASAMLERHQSVFYLEAMQPDWLSRPLQRWLVSVGSIVLCGLLVGVVVGVGNGLESDLIYSLSLALAFGLGGGLIVGALGYGDKIKPITRLRWSWWALREELALKLLLAVGVGVMIGVGVAWIFEVNIGIALGMATAVAFCYFGGIDVDLKPADLSRSTRPNRALRRSLHNALKGGTVGVLIGAVVGGLAGGESGVGFGAALFGVIAALLFGGHPCLQHLLLRGLLWRNGTAPWHYVPFLDSAVERILLHRVGGGYAFVHRALLEYFANLNQPPPNNKTPHS
ncbi:MAG: hypothetical protein FD130_159, partial [Halothiobacillaceae bacterium]